MRVSARVVCFLAASMLGLARANAVVDSRLGNLDESDISLRLNLELGAAAGPESQRGRELRQGLSSMYAALPKNAAGKLSRKVVRYALHRFFVHRNGWFIRGLEPSRGTDEVDAEHHTSMDLSEWIPSYLQDLFETHQHAEGADLDGLVVLAAALEDIIRVEAHSRLEVACSLHHLPKAFRVNRHAAEEVVSTWYAEFQRQNELEYLRLAGLPLEETRLEHKQDLIRKIPTWAADWRWIQGLITTVGGAPRDGIMFDFDALARVVDTISESFHSRNDPLCEDLKATLHGMESAKAGRVRLSAFYEAGRTSQWKFAEKKEYLRSLGALDESEPNRSYVIVENYVTSRSNCFAPSDVYVSCCRSSCEELMGEVEAGVGAASATPSDIVPIVANLPSPSVDAPRQLSTELLARLSQVAELHGGRVPLHGRLFAQWMHHAYPRECPYPQQEGGVNPRTPSEWLNETGQSAQASEEELLRHAAEDGCLVDAAGAVDCGESEALPWDTTEELFTSSGERSSSRLPLRAGGDWLRHSLRCACVVAAAGLLYVLLATRLQRASAARSPMQLATQQPRFVFGLLIVAAYVAGLLNFGLIFCMLICGCMAAAIQKVAKKSAEGCKEGCSAADKLV